MANRSESIAGAKMETSSFFVSVCAINFPKSPAGICFATAAHSSLPSDSENLGCGGEYPRIRVV